VLVPLSVDKAGPGSLTSFPAGIDCHNGGTCAARFVIGTAVTLIASPASDASFVGWSGAGCRHGLRCIVTMTGSESVSARFKAK
jgi:hypothetical protein